MALPSGVFHVLEFVMLLVDGVGYAILVFTVVKFVIRYVGFELHRARGLE